MTRLALIILAFIAVAIVAARCNPPARAQMGTSAGTFSAPFGPANRVATGTLAGTFRPAQAGPLALFAVGEARWVWITRRKDDAPIGATPEFVGAIYGEQAGGFRYEAGWTYMHDIPGATATIWPTQEPATETPTPAPTQTARIVVVVVTATPEPTGTAPPTATARPLSPVLLPVVVRPRVRR